MQRLLRALVLVVGAFLLTGLAAACDGGGEEPEATATEAATEEPTEEPTEEDEEATARTPSSAQPFESFHYIVNLEFAVEAPGEEGAGFSGRVEGDFVAPDSHAFTNTFEFGGLSGTQEVVIIDDDAWIREGRGDWEETTRSNPDVQDAIDLTSADPDFLTDEEFSEGISVLDSERERLNGVDTRRYDIPKEALETLAELLGEDFFDGADLTGIQEFQMTVWLDEDTDALVRAELSATAAPELFGEDLGFDIPPDALVRFTMTINVTEINDPGIQIEPPI